MFKKLFLTLVLIFALVFPVTLNADDVITKADVCVMMKGELIAQVTNVVDGKVFLQAVIVPEDTIVQMNDDVPDNIIKGMNSNTDIDWAGSRWATFHYDHGDGDGPILIVVAVRPSSLKDCH